MGISWPGILKKIFSLPSRNSFDIAELEAKLHYRFQDDSLLQLALTHRSHVKSSNSTSESFERLEFLGDSILGLVVSEFLYHTFPDKSEGDLTKLKSQLVNEITLSQNGKSIDLGRYIHLSPEEEKSGGRERNSIIADAFEALIAAVYIDGGLEVARRMIKTLILEKYLEIVGNKTYFNYKGELLEYMQAQGGAPPKYEVLIEEGPDHEKRFTIAVFVNGRKMGIGQGTTKKEAEQKAAKMAMEAIYEEYLRKDEMENYKRGDI